MSPFGRHLAILVAILPLALVILALETGVMDLCGPAQAAIAPRAGDPALCYAEFWLNRYQTLFSAAVALLAAFIAARPAWRQWQASERQLAALMGDLPPDIWVDWVDWQGDLIGQEGHLDPAILTVQNLNRRGVRVLRITLIEPADTKFWVSNAENKDKGFPGFRSELSTWDIECRIPGRGVGDSTAPVVSFLIEFDDYRDEARGGTDERVKFLVEYELFGAPGERHQVEVSGWVHRRVVYTRRVE